MAPAPTVSSTLVGLHRNDQKKVKTAPVLTKANFNKRFDVLVSERNTWLQTCQEISKYICPTRGVFNQPSTKGTKIDHKTLMDSQPERALRTLGTGMASGFTSPSKKWFKLSVSDQDLMKEKDVKMWLAHVEDTMTSIFQRSNVYSGLTSLYEELGGFGTAACIVIEDPHTVIRMLTFTMGSYFIGCSADGRVNTFGREQAMTVLQMIEEFGYENCSPAIQRSYDNNKVDLIFTYRHLIEPNDDRIPDKEDFKNMPWRSVYWEPGATGDTFLKVAGFEEFPAICPRWEVVKSADAYGKGPGWQALGDAKQLSLLQKQKLCALDKVINPPVVFDDSLDGQINTLPGGENKSNGANPSAAMRAFYQISPNFVEIENTITATKNAISETFYADLFLMMKSLDQRMTAMEVNQRSNESLLMLGSVTTRLESELLDPLIDRTFGISLRNGLIQTPPPHLQGHKLEVQYTSALSQAQKMTGTAGIQQTVQFVASLASAAPDILDVINFDEVANEYSTLVGVPPNIIRSPDEISKVRQQKSKQMQDQIQAERGSALAQGAKALSDAKLDNNSALDLMMNTLKNQRQQQGQELMQ